MAKLRRITLVDQVVDRLTVQIRDRRPEAEHELPSIAELSEQFGVSKVVVREALRSLEAQGVLELTNGKRARTVLESTRPLRGFFARALDFDAVSTAEMIELWSTIEIEAAALAALNRSEAELQVMQDLAHRSATEGGIRHVFGELDHELHEAILQASHNRLLRDLARSLRDTLGKVRTETAIGVAWESEHVRLNSLLLEAISRRDPEAARRAMRLHLQFHQPRRMEAKTPSQARQRRLTSA